MADDKTEFCFTCKFFYFHKQCRRRSPTFLGMKNGAPRSIYPPTTSWDYCGDWVEAKHEPKP